MKLDREVAKSLRKLLTPKEYMGFLRGSLYCIRLSIPTEITVGELKKQIDESRELEKELRLMEEIAEATNQQRKQKEEF